MAYMASPAGCVQRCFPSRSGMSPLLLSKAPGAMKLKAPEPWIGSHWHCIKDVLAANVHEPQVVLSMSPSQHLHEVGMPSLLSFFGS